jgi:tetratricopeptide (TPR) repeat protein
MRLRKRAALVRDAFWPLVLAVDAAVGLVLAGAPAFALTLAIAATLALAVAWRRIAWRLNRSLLLRHQRMVNAALDVDDKTASQRGYEELEEFYRAFAPRTQWARQMRANGLLVQHRWSDARAVLESIDRATLTPAEQASLDNNWAWLLAHDGATGEAVTLAERACAAASSLAERQRAFFHGTLGVALSLDGRHAQALKPLTLALELGGPKWAQAVRSLYLGESLWALVRIDEARAAWQRAVDEAPASEWGQRARLRLDTAVANAYR